MSLASGTKFGRYEIRSKIGAGGMGEVYLAEDTTLHRRVAIKFFSTEAAKDERARERLLREAQSAAKLDHPNICTVHEVAEDDGRSFIVMPYVEGETLDVRIRRKPLPISEALSIASQVADALADAHVHGIIHRDIKPSNIIITPRGQAKVMDFGLAKISTAITAAGSIKVDAEAPTEALLTTPGAILGTVPYMSPEQVHGQPLDPRTDIFSFGVVLYEMLTGEQPFTAETPAGTISAILTKEPAPISDYLTSSPADLQQLLTKSLSKDRETRYQTMDEVANDLENLSAESISERHLRESEKTVKIKAKPTAEQLVRGSDSWLTPRRMVLVLTALIVVALSIYFLFLRNSRSLVAATPKASDSPAYDNYLRARVLLTSENREDVDTAIKLLEQAVATDPKLAPAWAQLARAYHVKAFFYTPENARELDVSAQFDVDKALSIDPHLADAHFVRGLLLWTHANGFPHEQAIESYNRALAIDPNNDEAHHQLGMVYFHLGLFDKSWTEIQRAIAINPSNTLARARLGVIYLYRGQNEEALSVFKSTAEEKNPSLWAFQTATALFQLGRDNEALAVIDKYLHDYPKDEGGVGTSVRAMIFARSGKMQEAEAAIAKARDIGKDFGHFHHTAYNIASAYALMNKHTEAVNWLQTAADDGFPCYPLFAQDANLNNLRQDPAFITFMSNLKRQWERYGATL